MLNSHETKAAVDRRLSALALPLPKDAHLPVTSMQLSQLQLFFTRSLTDTRTRTH